MDELNNPNVKVIENATLDAGRTGDHISWEHTETFHGVARTIRREGIAHHRDQEGDWCTEEGRWITNGEGEDITLTIRRPIQELPTGFEATIVAHDKNTGIEAVVDGENWRTCEAIRGWNGCWYSVWRLGYRARLSVLPEEIIPGTWKVDEK